jgi:hypothetical protein
MYLENTSANKMVIEKITFTGKIDMDKIVWMLG